ncbi:hypothetical protein K701_16300 [Streptomyces fradiae ATCC 10745 = DSM 40063]|uniref:Uncharacterized protein n=1 Tax=Streptomyces fradiae ATCC 10745 = DSM 40063 TaxID=1319510 RepID=A0ABQ6XT32_STRFR|nr:hypothetical protein K701_16300 [Streptomyces fradiae ATCC 10745 = DSM 40063]
MQATAVDAAARAVSRTGPSPRAQRPGRGRVAGSVRATATARCAQAASGGAHQASRSAEAYGRSGWATA